MKGKKVGFSDEVSASSAKDQNSTSLMDASAREKNATGTNSTKRETSKHKPYGKLGAKGHPA